MDLESIIFGLKETIKEKDAEIARLASVNMETIGKNAELLKEIEDLKEKNEKLYEIGLNENTARFEDMKKIDRLEDEIAHKNGIIRLLEKDIEDLHKALEKRVEDVYEDFMKDYKLMREELDGASEENADLQNKLWDLQDDFDNLLAEGKKQAVKDTAKEIYSLMISAYEIYIPTDIAEEIAKRYGVEVE